MRIELITALESSTDVQTAVEVAVLLSIYNNTKDMPNCEKEHEAAEFLLRNWLLTEQQAKDLLDAI